MSILSAPPELTIPLPLLRLPRWLASHLDETRGEEAGTVGVAHAGAALAVLDAAMSAARPQAGVWAERLALAATARALEWLGRSEDEGALRDHIAFSAVGSTGPAAAEIRAYFWLAAGASADRWAELPDILSGLGVRNDTDQHALAAALAAAATASCPVAAATAGARAAAAVRPGRQALALWAADLVLVRWLGWCRGLPLITLGLPRRGLLGEGQSTAQAVLRGTSRALDQFTYLDRRAAALQATRPRLRARSAGPVLDRLLARDAVSVAGVRDLIPERAARRLFDRLVELGGVSELTGRSTARLYGL